MNAIDFLIKEHNKVRTMLEDINDDSHHFDTKKNRFELLAQTLIRHEHMEHKVWYPHFKNQLSDTVKHLIKEESMAEQEIKKIKALKTEASWVAHFSKFMEDVEHHAQEEENELFPEVQKILSEEQLQEIGQSMAQYKKDHSTE